MDRTSWEIGSQRLAYPEIGESITVRGGGPDADNLTSLWVISPSAHFDIDWCELHTVSENHEGAAEDQPDTFEGNYFKDGRICSDEWWCWKMDKDAWEPCPHGPIEFWVLGKRQTLTINKVGELIWRCTTLQALEEDCMYPPAIETTWTCKATKVDRQF